MFLRDYYEKDMRTIRHLGLKQYQGFSVHTQNQMLKFIFSVAILCTSIKQDKNYDVIVKIKLNQKTYVQKKPHSNET